MTEVTYPRLLELLDKRMKAKTLIGAGNVKSV